LRYVVWNDSVRIGDDAIAVANIFSIRVRSSAQGAAAVSDPGLVFSLITLPARTLKANPLDLLVVERAALQIVVLYLSFHVM
jgi:hypothetical protein